MGFHMARRLIEAGHKLTVFDVRPEAVARLAHARRSGCEIGARGGEPHRDGDGEPAVARGRASGRDRQGRRDRGHAVRRFVDLSTTGARIAVRIADTARRPRDRANRQPGERRRRRRREGHARGHGLGPARGDRAGQTGAFGVRQSVRHRRAAGHGADHEARQQSCSRPPRWPRPPRPWSWASRPGSIPR